MSETVTYSADGATVPLLREYTHHGTVFKSVRLRAPKLKDLMAIGEPYEAQTVNGNRVVIEHLDRLSAYLDRLAVAPTQEALGELQLPDAILVKEAVSGFFTQARVLLSSSATSSSSDTDGL
jgi:hypothetical protein